jgi:hypothetical protein
MGRARNSLRNLRRWFGTERADAVRQMARQGVARYDVTRHLIGALGTAFVVLHPNLASASVSRGQLNVSATVSGVATTAFHLVGTRELTTSGIGSSGVAVTVSCPKGLAIRVGIEQGQFAINSAAVARAGTPAYILTRKSRSLEPIICRVENQTRLVPLTVAMDGSPAAGSFRAISVTIEY